ncbi:MAG: MBL fold metallo-hydrolase [Cyclobacteriaceae bacterium]
METKIKFYGTRGSVPVCEPQFQEFGGNTTCIGFVHHNRMGILDAGTGIRAAGRDILASKVLQRNITVAFTHFHWDHIQGLPFFQPAYMEDRNINLLYLGRGEKTNNLEKAITQQMSGDYFPIGMDRMKAKFNFMMIQDNVMPNFYSTRTSTMDLNHPGGCLGYRIEVDGKVIVFCTDVEHGDQIDHRVVKFAKDADLLIHDAQYTTKELAVHRGWGHSSYEQAIEVAELADVKQLIMTHHDPDHDDAFLRKMETECQQRMNNCSLAREGMEIIV